MTYFDWNAYRASNGVGKNELRTMGAKSGAKNVYQAIQANRYAKYCNPTTWGRAFLGNNYYSSGTSGRSSGIFGSDSNSGTLKDNIMALLQALSSYFGNNVNDSNSSDSTSGSEIVESKVNMTGNPDQDAKNYAKKMNISIDEAKKQLKAKYGDPTKKTSSSSSSTSTNATTSSANTTASKTSTTSNSNKTSSSTKNDSTDVSSEFTKNETGRKKLGETIEYWRAKLKEATDAKDSSGVKYAQEQSKKYQQLAYTWDKG